MDFLNFPAILVAAISALIIGFIWYHPKVFGNSNNQIENSYGFKRLILGFIFALLLAVTMMQMSVHQTGVLQLIGGDVSKALPSYKAFMEDYGNNFRTFKHGVLHGVMASIFIALPIIGSNALFEGKKSKYILINTGYWMVTLGIMGGIICAWK